MKPAAAAGDSGSSWAGGSGGLGMLSSGRGGGAATGTWAVVDATVVASGSGVTHGTTLPNALEKRLVLTVLGVPGGVLDTKFSLIASAEGDDLLRR